MNDLLAFRVLVLFVFLTPSMRGQQASERLQNPPKFRVEVNQIYFNAVITDKAGRSVTGLTRHDFEIKENGIRQNITHFFPGELGCNVALLLETSCMRQMRLLIIKNEIRRFVAILRPQDRLAVMIYGREMTLIQSFSTDRTETERVISQIGIAGPPSAVYESVYAALEQMREMPGQKVLILLSDSAMDKSVFRLSSNRTAKETIEIASNSGTTLYSICYPDDFLPINPYSPTEDSSDPYSRSYFPPGRLERAAQLGRMYLADLAKVSGGSIYDIDFRVDLASQQSLRTALGQIASQIRSQYTFGYLTGHPSGDENFRKVELRPIRKRLKVRAKKGYFWPSRTEQ